MLRISSLLFLFILFLFSCKTDPELAPKLAENELWVRSLYVFTDEIESAILEFTPDEDGQARLRVQDFAELGKLKKARFVVCGIASGAPEGFLAEIEEHTTQGDVTEFRLRAASFPEVIRRGEINVEGALGTPWVYEDIARDNALRLELGMHLTFFARYDEEGLRPYDEISFSSKLEGESFLRINMQEAGLWQFQQALNIEPKSREFWVRTHDGRDFPIVISSALRADLDYRVENYGGGLMLNSPLVLSDVHGFRVKSGNVGYASGFWSSLWWLDFANAQWEINSMEYSENNYEAHAEYWFYQKLETPEHAIECEQSSAGVDLTCGTNGTAEGYFSGATLGLRSGHNLWQLTSDVELFQDITTEEGLSPVGMPTGVDFPCVK